MVDCPGESVVVEVNLIDKCTYKFITESCRRLSGFRIQFTRMGVEAPAKNIFLRSYNVKKK